MNGAGLHPRAVELVLQFFGDVIVEGHEDGPAPGNLEQGGRFDQGASLTSPGDGDDNQVARLLADEVKNPPLVLGRWMAVDAVVYHVVVIHQSISCPLATHNIALVVCGKNKALHNAQPCWLQ